MYTIKGIDKTIHNTETIKQNLSYSILVSMNKEIENLSNKMVSAILEGLSNGKR